MQIIYQQHHVRYFVLSFTDADGFGTILKAISYFKCYFFGITR